MPRQGKKDGKPRGERAAGRTGGRGGVDNGAASDEETSVFNDDASVISNASSGSIFRDEVVEEASTSDDLSTVDAFEDKLLEAMEMASQKSAQGRTTAIQGICKAFLKKFVPEFVAERFVTLTDVADRGLKRGKDGEQVAAANLAALVCIQLGLSSSSSTEEVFKTLEPTLTYQMLDPSCSPRSRGAMATALGVACFLACDSADFKETMEGLEKVFKPSCSASTAVGLGPEVTAMHTDALTVWSLLLTMTSPGKAKTMLANQIANLSTMLDSSDVELRIAAGEAIALLYESAREGDEDGAALLLVEPILLQLKQLATDSHKYRSKKDRKEQKSSFRDILKTIEDDQEYFEKININSREVLEIESWAQKKQYDVLCKVLSSGMNLHLTENELLRDIFQLGAPIPADSAQHMTKLSKLERHSANQQADKVRNQARGKNRDKRSAVI